ncbi:TadE/TadG family type IV pilus assembly protein [Nocardioides houyundeii]|uniref:TadE/TadG family type IV pilus assembly protein n=1 Tax=Nocardioides houyundeii TaxID=2045452 RepID=UPI000DF4779C|nr:TadE/TadG family type IV pilus assembly protein [Nocardioides houyundeii]
MSIRASRHDERGAAAVEFALIMPILFMLCFGIIDFGYAINRHSVINNASRDAAREASLGGTKAQIVAAANESLGNLAGATVVVSCKKPTGGACGSNYDTDAVSNGWAVVTVKYTHTMITPISYLFGNSIKLDRTAQMRIE